MGSNSDRNRYRKKVGIPLDAPKYAFKGGKPTRTLEEKRDYWNTRTKNRYFERTRPDLAGKVFLDGRWQFPPEEKRRRRNRMTYAKFLHYVSRRGLETDLTEIQFLALRAQDCNYCQGALPVSGCGLDRIDNKKGYLVDNVLPCCAACNKAKMEHLSPDEWRAILAMRKRS